MTDTKYNFVEVTGQYTQDRNFPRFIGYSRTGTHWFKILIESCIGKGCLPVTYLGATDWWGAFGHDIGLKANGLGNVIYIYRNPVDTVYSQLKFYRKETTPVNVNYYLDQYSVNLVRWVHFADDTQRIHYVSYDAMKQRTAQVIRSALNFLGYKMQLNDIAAICKSITPSRVKALVNEAEKKLSGEILTVDKSDRGAFEEEYGLLIWRTMKRLKLDQLWPR